MLRPETPQAAADAAADVADEVTGATPDNASRDELTDPSWEAASCARSTRRAGRPSSIRAESTVTTFSRTPLEAKASRTSKRGGPLVGATEPHRSHDRSLG